MLQRYPVHSAGSEPFPGYKLRELRGRGAFAEVWEAEAPDGSLVALKFMTSASPSVAAREVKAIQAVRNLRHPNLIRIDQVWFQAGHIVIAMELADGSLLELLEAYQNEFHTNVPPDELCGPMRQAAQALDFLNARCHSHDGTRVAFQHCDIKPSNILLLGDTVKVADFGLATALRSVSAPFARAGTVDFAPPEVFQSQLTDRSDQFALAVSWCYLRTARFPYPEPPGGRFDKGYSRPDPDLKLLDPVERGIVLRALCPAPLNRWPSSTAFIDQLAKVFLPAGAAANGTGSSHDLAVPPCDERA